MKKIILISLDTLRADHLGCYGYERNTSPVIDSLARESSRFERAFSACSYTGPSFASLLTSMYPSFNYMRFYNGKSLLPERKEPFLQEILKEKGFCTAAFVSTIVLNKKLTRFNDGFDLYDDEANLSEANRPNILFRRGEETTDKALSWLRDHYQGDFFLWVHYMDIHGPYMPPSPYDEMFIDDGFWRKEPVLLESIPTPNQYERCPEDYRPGIFDYQLLKESGSGEYEKNVDHYIARYDGAIRYADSQVERLLAELRTLGIYDDTLVIIHSDHGEALGENGIYFFHGLTVTFEQIRVPLIIKRPFQREAEEFISMPVSLIDLTPTVLGQFGLQGDYGFNGIDLFKDAHFPRKLFSQMVKQLSMIEGDIQVLYGKGWFEREYGNIFGFDIDERHCLLPSELRITDLKNISSVFPENSKEEMRSFISKAQARSRDLVPGLSMPEDEEIKKRLAALGYMDAGGSL